MYSLIYSQLNQKKSARLELDDTTNELSLMATFDKLGVAWSEYYSGGIASLIKRKYITAEDSVYKVTALGERVIDALSGYFDELFSAAAYNDVAAQVEAVAAGKAEKFSVIKTYCDAFNVKFDEAMAALGDVAPQSEPIQESEEICEKCGRHMLIRHGRYGVFLACAGYPECKNTKPLLEYLDKKCPTAGGWLSNRSITEKFFIAVKIFRPATFRLGTSRKP